MNILSEIENNKRKEIQSRLAHISSEMLKKSNADKRIPLRFDLALKQNTLSIISEVKKVSPSKGLIRENFDPYLIASQYEEYKANCISVLTDEKYFQGSPEYLKKIRNKVEIPLLRKDFILDPRQIRESYEMGADAILLIVASLSRKELIQFRKLADSFGLTSLVEVHSQEELKTALECNFNLIGINNRNLKTFETSIETSLQLKKLIPMGVICVSASGINTSEDCKKLWEAGFDAVLVGESLMRQSHPGKAMVQLKPVVSTRVSN